jgi:hypothetical protein
MTHYTMSNYDFIMRVIVDGTLLGMIWGWTFGKR